MAELVQTNGAILAVALVVVLLIAYWLFSRASKPAKRSYRPDVLDEGVAPAQRNQALIDSAPAAQMPPVIVPPASEILGGVGEIVAAAAHEEVVDAAAVATSAAAVPSAEGDDLTRIKGLGPRIRTLLAGLGVTRFEQIAAWSEQDIANIDAQLGAFAGRPTRDSWVEQAKLLAAGDTSAFEDRFGKM